MPRAPKKCGRIGCDQRVTGRTYCPAHTAEQQRRANTTARGYGWTHQQHRAAELANYTPGPPCTRCGNPILPDQPVQDDHTDDRTGYLGLAHARCNARAGGQRSHGDPRRGTSPRGSLP